MGKEERLQRFADRVDAAINARVSVPTWLLLFQNMMIGVVMSLAAWFNPELIGAAAHNALGAKAWTTMLAIASILVVVGLIRRKSRTLFCGSLLGTMSWLFASLSYLVAGNFDAVNALAFGLPGMIYFSYLHLKFSVFSVGTIGGHVLRGHSLK